MSMLWAAGVGLFPKWDERNKTERGRTKVGTVGKPCGKFGTRSDKTWEITGWLVSVPYVPTLLSYYLILYLYFARYDATMMIEDWKFAELLYGVIITSPSPSPTSRL